uniref:Tudor domain-containing protein n=1 Tax=Steinernema glaseri TaxID=37863 RepID=A0A1I7Y587_9BILA
MESDNVFRNCGSQKWSLKLSKDLLLDGLSMIGGPIGRYAMKEKQIRNPEAVHVDVFGGEIVRVAYEGKLPEDGLTLFNDVKEMLKARPRRLQVKEVDERKIDVIHSPIKCHQELSKMAKHAQELLLYNLGAPKHSVELIKHLPGTFKYVDIRGCALRPVDLVPFLGKLSENDRLERLIVEQEDIPDPIGLALVDLLDGSRWRFINIFFRTCGPRFLEAMMSWWDQASPSQDRRKLIVKMNSPKSRLVVEPLKSFMSPKDAKKFDNACFGGPEDEEVDEEHFDEISLGSEDGQKEEEKVEDVEEPIEPLIFDLNHPAGKYARVKKDDAFLELQIC